MSRRIGCCFALFTLFIYLVLPIGVNVYMWLKGIFEKEKDQG